MMLLGFPSGVWITMAVEFTERLGYYGTTFMLMMYCTSMLRWSPSTGNAVINGLYAATPVAACASSILSDGRWGRPFSLVIFLIMYAGGLSMVALSSFPFMYGDFPLEPSVGSLILFAIGISFFAIGYGGMKVCTNPLMADLVSEAHKDDEQKRERVLSQLFRWIYAVTNIGSLFGMFGPPFMRSLDDRRVEIGSVVYTTGFYYGFSVSAGSCIVGLLLFVVMYRRFHKNEPVPEFVLVRVFFLAIRIRWYFFTGRIRDDAFLSAHRWDLIDFAAYPAVGTYQPQSKETFTAVPDTFESSGKDGNEGNLVSHHTEPAVVNDNHDEAEQSGTSNDYASYDSEKLDQVWVDNTKTIISICRALVAMPIYWLITNQFSTNMILQATTTDLPPEVPPEIFNNINTIALLLSLFLFDRVLFPYMYGDRSPPVRGRVVVGCVLMIISMVWCGFVQIGIDHRGTYDADDSYHLHPGMKMLSPGWLVVPYIMQGVASALVDTTILEVVYVAAPTTMKGAVMALYLLTSSVSGFLGLALSPAMHPANAKVVIFSLSAALVLVTILFYFLNAPSATTAAPSVQPTEGSGGEERSHAVSKSEREALLLKEGRSRQEGAVYYGGLPHDENTAHGNTPAAVQH